MAKAVYPYELSDPDYTWLFETYLENNVAFAVVEETGLPVVLILREKETQISIIDDQVVLSSDDSEMITSQSATDNGSASEKIE